MVSHWCPGHKTGRMYNATIVADSINEFNHRLTTLEVEMPRIILAEFNTHRMLTRNSASSRAIPAKKMIDVVTNNPFIPLRWLKAHSGMQGNEYFTDLCGIDFKEVDRCFQYDEYKHMLSIQYLDNRWLEARDYMVSMAEELLNLRVSKQIINRLLEPFMWHKVLVSATEWENFLAQRTDPAAEIHMQATAQIIRDALNFSTPRFLKAGQWHLPYISIEDFKHFYLLPRDTDGIEYPLVYVSAARCAQTSYTVIDQEDKPMDYDKLIRLGRNLVKNGHWSPWEHPSLCMTQAEYSHAKFFRGQQMGWCGNFRGWIQARKQFPNENRSYPELVRKYDSVNDRLRKVSDSPGEQGSQA